MKFIMISLKSTEFHRISLNPSDFIMDSMIYFIKSNRISHNIMKSNTILLKAIGFHETQRIQSISWNFTTWNQQILLKATEFHRISWNQQNLTQFHKIQFHNFMLHPILLKPKLFHESNRILHLIKSRDFKGFQEIQQDFTKNSRISHNIMRSNTILLRAIAFYETQGTQSFNEIQQYFTKSNRISQDFMQSTEFNTIS